MANVDDWVKLVTEEVEREVKNLTLPKTESTVPKTPVTPPSHSNNHESGDAKSPADEEVVPKADASLINKIIHSQLVNTKSDIEVLRKDPKSPLYSVNSFDKLNLRPELLKGVYGMGFNAPSKIQETALPALLGEPTTINSQFLWRDVLPDARQMREEILGLGYRDLFIGSRILASIPQPANMIAQSQSGTGKTAAFVLTMLSRVNTNKNYTQCLCLAPTFELALQIGDVTKRMAKHINGIDIGFAIRGSQVQKNVPVSHHIVIGTPGTTLDWCAKWRVIDLKKIEVFVLDEADVMIDKQGHQDQSIRIKKQLRLDCQTLLFSATYDDEVMAFANAVVSDPIVIRLRREEESLVNIKQYYIECGDQNDKFNALSNIYGSISIGQSMIFCHTRRTALWLAEQMTKDGHAVALLSGELTVEQRASVIQRFRDGKEKVLITTNVSARGIDVEAVNVVVNFDLPVDQMNQVDYETYLHRIGRTGRFGKNGIAINMIDGSMAKQRLQQIKSHFGVEIAKLDSDDVDEIVKIGTKG